MAYKKEYPVVNSELEKDSIFEYTKRQEDRIESEFNSINANPSVPIKRETVDQGGYGFYVYEQFMDRTFVQEGVRRAVTSGSGYLAIPLHIKPKEAVAIVNHANYRERKAIVNGAFIEQRIETYSYIDGDPINGLGIALAYRIIGKI